MSKFELIDKIYKETATFDPFLVAEKKNIEVRYASLGNKPDGLTSFVFGQPIIVLNERLRETNKRYFVCAHELIHALEHDGLVSYYISGLNQRSKLENDVNNAAFVMMINLYLEEFGDYPSSFGNLAQAYGVTEECKEFIPIEKEDFLINRERTG